MRYLYFRLFKVLAKVKTNDTPAFNAMFMLTIFQICNILSVFMVVNYSFKREYNNHQSTIIGALLCFILLFLNYFFLFRKRAKIIKRYENETKEDRLWGIVALWIYVVVTIAVFFILGNTIVQKHY
jgi:amino acid transporter